MTTQTHVRPKRFYVPDGDGYLPKGLTISPWRGDSQNGVALGLIMSHALTAEPHYQAGHIARFTLDILRPAPAQRTVVRWRVARNGRRVQLLEGELESGGVVAARASALIVAPSGPAPDARPAPPPPSPPETAPEHAVIPAGTGLETRLVETRDAAASGRQSLWVRVVADIVEGSPATPVSAAIAAADFGASCMREYRKAWTSPNLDIAVHFARAPRGEWVHTACKPMALGAGIAIIDHHLSDRDGLFGRAHQTLYFSPVKRAAA